MGTSMTNSKVQKEYKPQEENLQQTNTLSVPAQGSRLPPKSPSNTRNPQSTSIIEQGNYAKTKKEDSEVRTSGAPM